MYMKTITVNNQVGLHARPATFFIQKANEFKSSIWIEKKASSAFSPSALSRVRISLSARKALMKKRRYWLFSS